jgi:signal peptidase I
MSGSGAREDFGSSPWRPDKAPEVTETRPIPGLSDAFRGADPAGNGSTAGGATGGGTTGAPVSDGGEPEPEPRPAKDTSSTKGRRSFWKELPILIVVALVLAVVIKSYAIQAFFIPSGSMQNTLAIGDRVLINKLVYHFRPIARGDIVVFNGDGSWDETPVQPSNDVFTKFLDDIGGIFGANQSNDIFVKRVIGVPGDHVACCNAQGQITVNGVALSESSYLYPGNAPSTTRFNITVPAGRLWVMGDHRAISYDSRGHMGMPGGGTIPENQVLGRAFVIIWPPSRWGFLNIPSTFSQPKLAAAAAGVAGGATPLAAGVVGAVPLTAVQAVARRRLARRRDRAGRDRGGKARRGAGQTA